MRAEVAVVVVLVLSVLAGATACFVLIPIKTPGPYYGPVGAAINLSTPSEANSTGGHWYNFSVRTLGPAVRFYDLGFQVIGWWAHVVPPTHAWTLTVDDATGVSLGVYDMVNNTWTAGGADFLTSSQVISLDATEVLSGDSLQVIGTGTLTGNILVPIP